MSFTLDIKSHLIEIQTIPTLHQVANKKSNEMSWLCSFCNKDIKIVPILCYKYKNWTCSLFFVLIRFRLEICGCNYIPINLTLINKILLTLALLFCIYSHHSILSLRGSNLVIGCHSTMSPSCAWAYCQLSQPELHHKQSFSASALLISLAILTLVGNVLLLCSWVNCVVCLE